MVFFTDGLPTVGETNPEKILATAGQEHHQHAHLHLRRRRRRQRRPARPAGRQDPGRQHLRPARRGHRGQDQRPVRQDQPSGADQPQADGRQCVTLSSLPDALPDLFHGGQLVVLGRYDGKGPTAIKLTGRSARRPGVRLRGQLPVQDRDEKSFVVDLGRGARLGYLLEQIRSNGEKKDWWTRWSPWPRSTASPRRTPAIWWYPTRRGRRQRQAAPTLRDYARLHGRDASGNGVPPVAGEMPGSEQIGVKYYNNDGSPAWRDGWWRDWGAWRKRGPDQLCPGFRRADDAVETHPRQLHRCCLR